MQKFCTHDGGRLMPDRDAPKAFDPNATVHVNASSMDVPTTPSLPDLNATIAGVQPPPATSTSEFRDGKTSASGFPDTTRLGNSQAGPTAAPPSPEPAAPPAPPEPTPPVPTILGPISDALPPAEDRANKATIVSTPASAAPPSEWTRPDLDTDAPPQPQSSTYPITPEPEQPGTSAPLPPPAYQTGQVSTSAPLPQRAPAKKSGNLVWILVGTALVLLVLVGAIGAVGYFYLKRKAPTADPGVVNVNPPQDANANATVSPDPNANANATSSPEVANTPPPVEPPPNSVKFENSATNLSGVLAEHYVDFSLYYPQSWKIDPSAGVPGATNFFEVARKLNADSLQESFNASWYESSGTMEKDMENFPSIVDNFSSRLAKTLPNYQKVSDGPTEVNALRAYEFRFQGHATGTAQGDFDYWGRVIFIPPGTDGAKNGVRILLLTYSFAPEITGVDDVGVKGELPMLLRTFRIGKS